MLASVKSTKNTAFLPATGLVNGQLVKILLEFVLCLRTFHTADNECPPTCQTAKIVSTKLLLQTLCGTTLNFSRHKKCMFGSNSFDGISFIHQVFSMISGSKSLLRITCNFSCELGLHRQKLPQHTISHVT